MRYKNLDLNLLAALDALLHEQNVSAAAKRLNLSQSAASNALARLREHFDDELLTTVGRHLTLTPRAQELMHAVRDVLNNIDQHILAPPRFEPRTAVREFSMLVSDFTTTVFMPRLLQVLHTSAPHLQVHMCAQSKSPKELIERGEADFLIIPEQFVSSAHPCVRLFEEEYVVIGWREHPWIKEELSLNDYLRAGHVAANFGTLVTQGRPLLESWFLEQRGIVRNVEVTAPTLTALPHLVVGTQRIATIHKRLAQIAMQYLPIQVWPAPMPVPRLVQMLQWQKTRGADMGLKWFRDLCLQIGQEMSTA